MPNKLIDIVGVSKSYGDNLVLDDLNLYIRENEFLTLLGPSGCGKTTVTCALLQALAESGRCPGAAKCGPDYIDPMFHRAITGAAGCNLDPFFFDDDTMRFLLAQAGAGKDVTLIEGVMGYYDGIGLASSRASTFEAAQRTESPVVLVLNAKGAGLSVLAVLEGFLRFVPRSGICGVVLNGCTAMSYPTLKREIESRFGIRACGFLPQLPDLSLIHISEPTRP